MLCKLKTKQIDTLPLDCQLLPSLGQSINLWFTCLTNPAGQTSQVPREFGEYVDRCGRWQLRADRPHHDAGKTVSAERRDFVKK